MARAPRKKSPEVLLREALESDDNLKILKAQRKIIVEDLIASDEPGDRVRLQGSLTQVNKEIIRLEGAKEEKSKDIEESFSKDSELRKNPLGGE